MEKLHQNTAKQRYEIEVEGQIVFADYRMDGETLYIPHVEAPPALQGTRAAGRLMQAVVAEARRHRWKIVPTCSYAAAWIYRHAEHRDLLA